MKRIDYFLAGVGGALIVTLIYLLSPAVLQAIQYPAVMLTDNSGNYVGSVANPIAVSGGPSSTQTSLLTAASGTYTTPTGATWLDVCVLGAGGGGGAATSGGAAAHSGGGGGAGALTCSLIIAPTGSYAYTNCVGGTAGTCSATPTAAGNATGTSTFGTGATQVIASCGFGAGTATTVADGIAGAACAVQPTVGAIQHYSNLGGVAGQTGTGAVASLGGSDRGGIGGVGATVTAGGVCNTPAAAGQNGFITVRAFFN